MEAFHEILASLLTTAVATHDQNHGGKGLGRAAAGLPVIFLGGKKLSQVTWDWQASNEKSDWGLGHRVLKGRVLARTVLCQVLMLVS